MQWRISDFRIIRTLYVYVGIILRCFPTLHAKNRISDSQYVEYGCFVPLFSVFFAKREYIRQSNKKLFMQELIYFHFKDRRHTRFRWGLRDHEVRKNAEKDNG